MLMETRAQGRCTASALVSLTLMAAALMMSGCGGVDEAGVSPLSVGDLEETGRTLDVAVSGEGFLMLSDTNGSNRRYSRLGRLDIDSQGHLIHSDGGSVLGMAADLDDASSTASPLAPIEMTMAPRRTSTVVVQEQLDARTAPVSEQAGFDPNDASTYNNAMAVQVWTDAGESVILTLYVRRLSGATPASPQEPDRWEVRLGANGVTFEQPLAVLTFEPDGTQPRTSRWSWAIDLPALPRISGEGKTQPLPQLVINMDGSMQYAAPFLHIANSADGWKSGTLLAATIDSLGALTTTYSNGQQRAVGQLTLARFTMADRLQRYGSTAWVCGWPCTPPDEGLPGTHLRGLLVAGALNKEF